MKQLIIKSFVYGSVKIPYILIILILIITPDEFLNISENRRDYKYKEYLNNLTYKKLYNKVREIEDHEIKYKFIIIRDYLKDKTICGSAVYRERERVFVRVNVWHI